MNHSDREDLAKVQHMVFGCLQVLRAAHNIIERIDNTHPSVPTLSVAVKLTTAVERRLDGQLKRPVLAEVVPMPKRPRGTHESGHVGPTEGLE